jgi:hypothetical protein
MIDSSENQMWSFRGGAVKRPRAGTAHIKGAGPRSNNHCRRDQGASPASYFITHNCKAF